MDIGGWKMDAVTMLDEVNKAISNILVGGQSYKMGSRELTRADLKMLYTMKNDLIAQIQTENTNLLSDTYVAFFEGR